MAQLPIFPQTNIGYPVVRRPYFSTIVNTASSGLEVRIGNQLYPLSEWDLLFEWLKADQAHQTFQTLYGFYVSNYGKFGSFLYLDKTDCTTSLDPANPTPTVVIADGVTQTYQLGRSWPAGGQTGFEPVFDIDTTTVAFNNPPIITPGGYTLGPNGSLNWGNGALPVGTKITMDFRYYWRVRFAEDDLEFSNFGQYYWECKKLTLRQVRQ